MKKRAYLILLLCVLSAAAVGIGLVVRGGRRPYRDFETVQLSSAEVLLTPPDRTVPVTDMDKFVDLLKDVVIYHEDNSYTEYAGQGVMFTLTMTDGTQTRIMAFNPFLVIDGIGYRTKYEPCEALSQYANMLLEEQDRIGS